MKENNRPPPKSSSKRFALAAGVMCVACCAAPLLTLALGSAVLAGFTAYFEYATVFFLLVSVGFLLFAFLKKKPATCDLNCVKNPNIKETSGS